VRVFSHLSLFPAFFLISGLWLLNPRILTLTGGDGWWLACYARAFWTTGHIPQQAIGSFVLEGYTYHHPAWLYGLWTFLWLSLGGPRLWVWMDALIPGILGIFAAWRILARDGLDIWTRAVLLGWVGALSWAGQTQRGQIWCIVLFLWLLLWIRETLEAPEVPRAILWRFPLITFLWAGFQGGFFLPLGVMALALLFRPGKIPIIAFLFAILATFLHPYAPQNWVDHLLILRHPPTFIWEWQSLPQVIRNLSAVYGEPIPFVAAVALLPYLLALAPLALARRPQTRWSLFLALLTASFTIGALRHVRQLLWALNAGMLLWGNRLGVRSFHLPRALIHFHLILAFLGWGLRLPALVGTGYTGQEESEAFLQHLASLPPGRVFAAHQVANTLCWLNPNLSQWMYGTFQLGIARNDAEWDQITREVVQPLLEIPKGGEKALTFLMDHRVAYVILHRTWDAGLRETLEKAGCPEEKRGLAFSLFVLRDCLWRTPDGSLPPAEDPAP